MNGTLDIAPLRSLVAVADRGGFQRAATSLYLSQAAISQHVRRLESTLGLPLVERQGRGSRFTADGERLLAHARRLLAVHDEALRSMGVQQEETVVIGSTEHGAAQLLPHLAATFEQTLPEQQVQFRIDRGTALRESLAAGRLALAILIGATDDPAATPVGELELTWYSSPTWTRPPGPLPVVAFDEPCALRSRAMETLAAQHIPATPGAEANQLAGVHAAVGAGLGVALMATLGQTPAGLVPRYDLPRAEPLPLALWSRTGLAPQITDEAAYALRALLTTSTSRPLAQGA